MKIFELIKIKISYKTYLIYIRLRIPERESCFNCLVFVILLASNLFGFRFAEI